MLEEIALVRLIPADLIRLNRSHVQPIDQGRGEETVDDPAVRREMRAIAEEELEHALLAWDVHLWAMSVLPDTARRATERAMEQAALELAHDLVHRADAPWASRVGLPSVAARADAVRDFGRLWLGRRVAPV